MNMAWRWSSPGVGIFAIDARLPRQQRTAYAETTVHQPVANPGVILLPAVCVHAARDVLSHCLLPPFDAPYNSNSQLPTAGCSRFFRKKPMRHLTLAAATCCAAIAGILSDKPGDAADAPRSGPIGQFMTVSSPVDDVMFSRVNNAALELQNRAAQADRQAILVLQIEPGTSKSGQIRDLAKFLTSSKLSRVRTVAWIPKTVTGNNAILALACNEIVLHPDAELGDFGRGNALDDDEQQFVLSLVNRRHNRMVAPGLAAGMMDPAVVVMRVEVGEDAESSETRILTLEELKRLQDTGIAIRNAETIKETGIPGRFSGRQAGRGGFLVTQTREQRADVAALYDLPADAMREDPTLGETPRASMIRVDDVISPVLEAFINRQVQRALDEDVNLIVFEIESPGGLLVSSMNLAFMIAELEAKQVRTAAWIPREALSGAAIIAMGCDEIYLRRSANIGDAGPIELREGGQFEHVPEKILSLLRNQMKDLAERKGRPPALLMAMADKDLRVFKATNSETGRVTWMTQDEIDDSNGEWIKGPVVPESEEDLLLTLSGTRAHEVGLAQAPVDGIAELKERLGLPQDVELVAAKRTWVDSLIFFLNTNFAMFLLVSLGVIFIYLELHFTSGLLGILSLLCFAVFFWSRFLGGTANGLEIILFLLGLGCIGLEIFVIPGFGVFGVSGGLLVAVSLVLASQTFGNIEPNADFYAASRTMGYLGASIVTVIGTGMILNRYLPRIPLLNAMVLSPPSAGGSGNPNEPHLRPEYTLKDSTTAGIGHDPTLVGCRGPATSTLRPAGKALLRGEYIDVVSDGPYITEGAEIEVVSVTGNRVVVRSVS